MTLRFSHWYGRVTTAACSLTNVTHVDGGTACASTRTFTIVVSDACLNKTTNTLFYPWTADTTRRRSALRWAQFRLGCNPASIPDDTAVLALVRARRHLQPASTNVTAVDGGTALRLDSAFTIVVTDACLKQTTTRCFTPGTADSTPPTISAPQGTIPLGSSGEHSG